MRIEVQSLWTPEYVRLLLTAKDRDCYGHHTFFSSSYCSEVINTKKIVQLFVKIDEQIYQISGQHNMFPVDSKLASALSSASEQEIKFAWSQKVAYRWIAKLVKKPFRLGKPSINLRFRVVWNSNTSLFCEPTGVTFSRSVELGMIPIWFK